MDDPNDLYAGFDGQDLDIIIQMAHYLLRNDYPSYRDLGFMLKPKLDEIQVAHLAQRINEYLKKRAIGRN